MNAIEVKIPTTYGAREATKAIIEGFGGKDCVKSVMLNTKKEEPDFFEESENWPVRFQCMSCLEGLAEFEIRVFMMMSGYNGTGPKDLINLLFSAGFDVDEERILNETINERWDKEE